jgi:signal transduction histidine kinase
MNRFAKIFSSIFTKLFLVLLMAGIGIHLSVVFYFHYRSDRTENPEFQKSIFYFLSDLTRDIGNPPDSEQAMKISRESSIQIRYESPTRNWSTSESMSVPPRMKFRAWPGYPNILTGGRRGSHLFVWQEGEGRLYFQLPAPFNREFFNMEAVVILLVLLTVNLTAAYLLIRLTLGPIRGLTEGVKEVGKGNLDHRVRLNRSDELGELARAFNAMTERIRSMLRAKEQLLLDVSHELRSPLTRMKVALESLSETQMKKSIKEDVADMERMVTEVLQTARSHYMYGQLNLQRIDLVALVKGVLSMFKEPGPAIRGGEMPDRLELYIDPDRVRTVVKNVLDNAVKYSFESSRPVEVSIENRKPHWVVSIRDHGVGIPEDELPYIFEPFYRVDKSRSKDTGGYGLGLSLGKTVMEAHQGKIEVDSAPGRGTTVRLLFPYPNPEVFPKA